MAMARTRTTTTTAPSGNNVADKYEVERLLRALNKSHLHLRIYALTLLTTSLFFLGWSILSFFFTVQYLSFFGILTFLTSIITSCFLLTDRAAQTGCCTKLNFFFSQLGIGIYFFASAMVSRNLSYGKGWTIAAGAIFGVCLCGSFVGMVLLNRVQKLALMYVTMEVCDGESEGFVSEDRYVDRGEEEEDVRMVQIPSSLEEEEEEEERMDDSFSEDSFSQSTDQRMESGQMVDDSHLSVASSSDFEVESVHASGMNEEEFEVQYRG